MSGLAKYFIEKGISVLGYDREKSFITEGLIKLGANVIYDPSKLNISEFIDNKKDTLIVYTSAISKNHPILKVFLEINLKFTKIWDFTKNLKIWSMYCDSWNSR